MRRQEDKGLGLGRAPDDTDAESGVKLHLHAVLHQTGSFKNNKNKFYPARPQSASRKPERAAQAMESVFENSPRNNTNVRAGQQLSYVWLPKLQCR